MSNSSLVKYKKISPNRTSPRTAKIDTITIHCMAGQLSVETCGNVFAPTSRQASSNYGVGPDGRIGMYVEEKDRAWTSSNRANDMRAVTIEVASDSKYPYAVTAKAMSATIDLVADICKRNGIKKLVWSSNKTDRVNHRNGCNMTVHRDFAATACPGEYLLGKMAEIASKVNAKLGSGSTTTPATKPTTSTQKNPYPEPVNIVITRGSVGNGAKWVQWHLARLGYYKDKIDGLFGPNSMAALKAFQKAKKLTVDGLCGGKTRAALKAAK